MFVVASGSGIRRVVPTGLSTGTLSDVPVHGLLKEGVIDLTAAKRGDQAPRCTPATFDPWLTFLHPILENSRAADDIKRVNL